MISYVEDKLRFYEIDSGHEVNNLDLGVRGSDVDLLSANGDATLVALEISNVGLKVADLTTNRLSETVFQGSKIRGLRFSPDSRRLAVISEDNKLRTFERRHGWPAGVKVLRMVGSRKCFANSI